MSLTSDGWPEGIISQEVSMKPLGYLAPYGEMRSSGPYGMREMSRAEAMDLGTESLKALEDILFDRYRYALFLLSDIYRRIPSPFHSETYASYLSEKQFYEHYDVRVGYSLTEFKREGYTVERSNRLQRMLEEIEEHIEAQGVSLNKLWISYKVKSKDWPGLDGELFRRIGRMIKRVLDRLVRAKHDFLLAIEKSTISLVWLLPRELVFWCAFHVAAHSAPEVNFTFLRCFQPFRFYLILSWFMPKAIKEWSFTRMCACASCGEFSSIEMGYITVGNAISAWGVPHAWRDLSGDAFFDNRVVEVLQNYIDKGKNHG